MNNKEKTYYKVLPSEDRIKIRNKNLIILMVMFSIFLLLFLITGIYSGVICVLSIIPIVMFIHYKDSKKEIVLNNEMFIVYNKKKKIFESSYRDIVSIQITTKYFKGINRGEQLFVVTTDQEFKLMDYIFFVGDFSKIIEIANYHCKTTLKSNKAKD